MDIKTLDETSDFRFRTARCREQWDDMIWYNYFTDPELKGAMDFARRWAKCMQHFMNNGKKIIDIYQQTAKEADIDHITHSQYIRAIELLKEYWLYGNELYLLVKKNGDSIDVIIR